MLDTKTIKKINDFVYVKPRTIQEIAVFLKKNWRTADRYVNQIAEETGSLSTRTFREGTRGALKVVYWNNIEKIHSSELQEKLFKKIEGGREKTDFSPFDIYQYVDESRRSAFLEEQEDEAKVVKQDLNGLFKSAQKQILIFSGNLSWANLTGMTDILEELAKQNILIKILTRVDLSGLKNTKRVLALNERVGKEAIEIRHCEQPLRAFIIDNKIARFKEIKNPEDYKKEELKKRTFIFYEIFDEEWIEWLQKVFWALFRTAISARKRITDLNSIQKINIL